MVGWSGGLAQPPQRRVTSAGDGVPPLPAGVAAAMAAPPLIITDPAEMRAWSRARRAEGKRVGFVPTMVGGEEG